MIILNNNSGELALRPLLEHIFGGAVGVGTLHQTLDLALPHNP
jgi:hypothetical protein